MSYIVSFDQQLPGSIQSPVEIAMEGLPTLWARLTVGVVSETSLLAAAIAEAEALSDGQIREVRAQGCVASAAEQGEFFRMLVTAWPNASQADLAGYGLQLRNDLANERPSRFALGQAGRQLRRSCRFLPSISEVLDAIAAADQQMAAVLKTLDRIPEALERAKAAAHV